MLGGHHIVCVFRLHVTLLDTMKNNSCSRYRIFHRVPITQQSLIPTGNNLALKSRFFHSRFGYQGQKSFHQKRRNLRNHQWFSLVCQRSTVLSESLEYNVHKLQLEIYQWNRVGSLIVGFNSQLHKCAIFWSVSYNLRPSSKLSYWYAQFRRHWKNSVLSFGHTQAASEPSEGKSFHLFYDYRLQYSIVDKVACKCNVLCNSQISTQNRTTNRIQWAGRSESASEFSTPVCMKSDRSRRHLLWNERSIRAVITS